MIHASPTQAALEAALTGTSLVARLPHLVAVNALKGNASVSGRALEGISRYTHSNYDARTRASVDGGRVLVLVVLLSDVAD